MLYASNNSEIIKTQQGKVNLLWAFVEDTYHKRMFHTNRTRCKICQLIFERRVDLKFHLDVHVYGAQCCEACPQRFTDRKEYQHYLRLEHGPLMKLEKETVNEVVQSTPYGDLISRANN